MKKILFVCEDGTHKSVMAAALAQKHWGANNVEVHAAALRVQPLHPGAANILSDNQVPLYKGAVKKLTDVNVDDYYAVITLSGLAEEETPEPRREVLKFFWNLPNAAGFRGSEELVEEMYFRLFTELQGNIEEITKYVLPN